MVVIPLIDALRGGAADTNAPARARDNSRNIGMSEEAGQGVVTPAENMHGAAANHQQGYGYQNFIRTAKVVYSVPHLNWYRIQFDSGGPDYRACMLTESAMQPFGVRNPSPLPVETMVLALWDPDAHFAVILGCLPEVVSDGSMMHPGFISQGSSVGFKRDRYFKDMPSLLKENAGWIDWSDNRPIDGLATGEWGRLDDLGGGIFIDSMMKFLRIDESCGLWMYYMDRLARLMCNNLDIISSVHEQIIRNDNGESLNALGSTAYYWEALGAFASGTDSHREETSEDVHFKKPYGKYEPVHDDQQAFYRLEEFRGYLGQAHMRQLTLPPYAPPELNRYSGEEVRVGVFREQLSMDGGWAVESAHSISLAKRVLIPIAKRKLLPEDPTGDDLEQDSGGYKFAGKFGEGPSHVIQDTPRAADGADLPHLLTAAAMQDVAAYYFNWKSMHPFHYHKSDFQTPQESELEPFTTLQYKPAFGSLDGQMWLDPPTSRTVPVDHRHDAKYYETTAGFFITPEGNLVMRDGAGVEVKTGGGNLQISAPGDILLQPGRSVIAYAGDDVVIKANKSVDITASQKDVRIKAEKNMDIMSGNGGTGRLLIESKATGIEYDPDGKEGEDLEDPGLIFKNAKGQVAMWARDIYLRTGGGDVQAGKIVLDVAKGRQNLEIIANELHAHLDSYAAISLPVEEPQVVHYFDRYRASLPTQMHVGKMLTVATGGIVSGGSISVFGGSVATSGSESGLMGFFAPGSDGHQSLADILAAITADFQTHVDTQQSHLTDDLEPNFWAEKRIGYGDVIEKTSYAPRNDEQLNSTDFKLPINYWQQLAGSSAPSTWSEPVIKYQGQEMMPHPGKQKWSVDTTFLKVLLKLHDEDTGVDKDRTESSNPYDEPNLKDWDAVIPDSNYPIIT